MTIEIYDCTLREGEQASGARFSLDERLELFHKLDEFGMNFIELGWPSASQEVFDSFEQARKIRKNARIVVFGRTSKNEDVKNDENLNLLVKTKADYACIFGKTNLEHVEKQLKLTGEENLRIIGKSIEFLKRNMPVFYDAEHYFDGFKQNKEYAIKTIVAAVEAGAERIILCDTNGGTLPDEAGKIVQETRKRLEQVGFKNNLGVHFHDDQGLALANTLACLEDVVQVQGTINGIGERVGNLNFTEFLPIYMLKLNGKLNINLKELKELNEEAYRISGIAIPEIRAFVGDSAFAHKGGVHIDAQVKGASYEHINPEDVGNRSLTILNTLGGASCVASVASQFGYSLNKKDSEVQEKIERLFEELGEYENAGYRIGALKAEQFLLIEKYFGRLDRVLDVDSWRIQTEMKKGVEKSLFNAECIIDGKKADKSLLVHGGPVDAAYKTFKNILRGKYPEIDELELVDFHVGIARSRKEESTVRTLITFKDREEFEIVGVDNNLLQSSIEAMTKGIRYFINSRRKGI